MPQNGSQLAAYLKIIPKQNSSSNKYQLSRITKRCHTYIRTLLIHGGRSVVKIVSKNNLYASWIKSLKSTKHEYVTCVAVANKNTRIIWSIIKTCNTYSCKTIKFSDILWVILAFI
jgi:transposase